MLLSYVGDLDYFYEPFGQCLSDPERKQKNYRLFSVQVYIECNVFRSDLTFDQKFGKIFMFKWPK